jgi:hypothetical protein
MPPRAAAFAVNTYAYILSHGAKDCLDHLANLGHTDCHDTVGSSVVPFAALPPVLAKIGYTELPMLEIITDTPDKDIQASAEKLIAMGWPASKRGQ